MPRCGMQPGNILYVSNVITTYNFPRLYIGDCTTYLNCRTKLKEIEYAVILPYFTNGYAMASKIFFPRKTIWQSFYYKDSQSLRGILASSLRASNVLQGKRDKSWLCWYHHSCFQVELGSGNKVSCSRLQPTAGFKNRTHCHMSMNATLSPKINKYGMIVACALKV